ncbi:MAG: hypothetical protein AAGH88_13905 [Planctomycetota bacterium]
MNFTDPQPEELAKMPRTPALLLDKRHAAMALSISERQLDRLVAEGHITPINLGRQCPRFSVKHLAEWIDSQVVTQHPPSQTDAA